MSPVNIRLFQESITKELKYTKDRVRNLIGNANWGEDGRFKEAILAKIIGQFLPSNLRIGTGFIVGNNDHVYGREGLISHQLDLIIYDGGAPVVFKEGDFVILTESAVRGVIEVKSSLIAYSETGNQGLNNVIEKLNHLRRFRTFSNAGEGRKKFVGVFSFDFDGDIGSERIDNALRASNGLVNHISLGTDNFIRYWENTIGLQPPIEDYQGRCYIRYILHNLSFSYFISNLLHIVSDTDPVERYWFSFPIEGTKEMYRHERIVRLQ
ncbi:DUF6602 domain-containing protein [Chitinophaga sp. 30R24]|uniref:DUF6602 domain-containing protein n=1 Tax=Chitinophaga sp. 30R24 TaxID=3248838 RepID=UPI003B91A185